MRWQIVMNEQLSIHKEERDIVNGPDEDEESSVIPEPVTYTYRQEVHYIPLERIIRTYNQEWVRCPGVSPEDLRQ